MKKRNLVFAGLVSLMLFGGCSSDQADSTDSSSAKETVSSTKKNELHSSITLLDGDKELSKKEITFKEGQNLFDALKDNYTIEDDDGMITSIDGHAQDAKNKKYWVFTINDEQVNAGAKDVVLKKDDRVVFKLEQF
ncbi:MULTISPECIES: DUF4430 domain-containing protein [Enterococcus]|uniref:Transcobalamin-like C-terminal domain-containing protein n=1 Tax=Enterococcus malodoratus ATCC 43197 TaxID=1158601 RepID=R2RGY0_9ENTE|nr:MULTISPECIES: DUF4430 domain-containing protein [Enterococcus]EOH75264.1 hypothetical protein UAI_03066 [Enterococcus malodoratus ATCC 43197]EOT66726.1 hypothetical protein I585_02247 [Enterococcus malodoratus ATCC 43197]OJG65978.1 hypothetical protein RV07_GL001565 [Enterococcus malodoratus]SPW90748.1 Additional lipoprotein component of predicted cobalamin ECF transporter [Enterococcus malodoratus]STD70021.1 Additional lipoprotein component of predicted cobalamin ECF transporter [Enterococ